jgi:outer membrane protein assembly factor BamE (lipoprotein component of BamABCDE complex)
MKNYMKTSLVFGLATIVIGCTPIKQQQGYRMDSDQLALIEPGQSDKEKVLALMGSPSNIATFQKEGDTWYYISRKTERVAFMANETVAQHVWVIAFDGTDTVTGIKEYKKEDGHDVAFVERKTPTKGKELGIVEQLFGNFGRFNNEDQDYFAN